MIVKKFSGIKLIKIESSAKVSIIQGQEFEVSISGDDAEKVKIQQSGSEIEINYSEPGGNFSFSGGNISIGSVSGTNIRNIRSGGKNISIINGEVYINGKRVDESGVVDNAPVKKPVEIEIQCPDGLLIDCVLTGDGILGAFPKFDQARITIKGGGEAGVQAKSGKLKISGSGDINYKSLGGNLKATIAGSGDINASGGFADLEASVNGSGDINTIGEVAGDYEADICGSGDIRHSGKVSGSKRKSISGTGSVKWS